MEPCTRRCSGMLVIRDNRLLLIERRRYPYGWAPPAGHVDPGETFEEAARRELQEEVGLSTISLRRVLSVAYDNRCRRPAGDHHYWEVFFMETEGNTTRSEAETSGVKWVDRDELSKLISISFDLLAFHSSDLAWKSAPGLEPVWINLLDRIGLDNVFHSDRKSS